MEYEIIGAMVAMLFGLIMIGKKQATVQTNLFGEVISPVVENEKIEKVWENLRELCMALTLGGSVERTIRGFSVKVGEQVNRPRITLFFDDDRATCLWMKPLPKDLEKFPNLRADGEKFVRTLVNAMGVSIVTDEDIVNLLESATSKDGRALVVKVTKSQMTLNDGRVVDFPRWSFRWVTVPEGA